MNGSSASRTDGARERDRGARGGQANWIATIPATAATGIRGCRGGANRRPLRGSLSAKFHGVRENGEKKNSKVFLVPPGRPRDSDWSCELCRRLKCEPRCYRDPSVGREVLIPEQLGSSSGGIVLHFLLTLNVLRINPEGSLDFLDIGHRRWLSILTPVRGDPAKRRDTHDTVQWQDWEIEHVVDKLCRDFPNQPRAAIERDIKGCMESDTSFLRARKTHRFK